MKKRYSTGIEQLDDALGGGLLPGSLTMVIGATGVGKTQLGIQCMEAGRTTEGVPGAVIDLSSRGDSQNHFGYAERLAGTSLKAEPISNERLAHPFTESRPGDHLAFLGYRGRRVLRSQMDVDEWNAWQSELNRRLPQLYHFVYRHLIHGTRRFVIDGIEPQDSSSDSLQLDILELIYHRMLRQEHDWLAREVLRERFRENEQRVNQHAYEHTDSSAIVLVTTRQTMLDQLMTEPLASGDLAAGANTVILLGRQLQEGHMGRAMYIAKHRGSYAHQHVIPFEIGERGITLTTSQ